MNLQKRLWKVVGFIVFVLLLAACADKSDDVATETEGNGEQGMEASLEDTYTLVTDNSFVPFEFIENDELVGFDIDLIHAIADEAGFELEVEQTNFDGIIPGLQTGQFDIAVAGIGITEERKAVIDYSDPYFESGLAIGVRVDNENIEDIEDLEGKTIATRLGSTSSAYISEHIEGANASEFEQLDQAYLAVENGSADAVLYDDPNVRYYIQTQGEDSLKVVGDLYEAEDYGIAITQGKPELVEAINDALQTLRDDGTYDEIYEEWFGATDE